MRVSGLAGHTTYHFRAVGTNAVGRGDGEDMTFTTGNTDPEGEDRTLHAPPVGSSDGGLFNE